MKKPLPIPFCFYGEPAQQLPLPVLERIVKACKTIGEPFYINHEKGTFFEKETGREWSYFAYNKMRYERMVEMLVPIGITEEQIAAWDMSIDGIIRRYEHFIPTYNLLFKNETFAKLEQAILEAAKKDDDCLDDLLQEAIEQMDEERANHLLDKVHQIVKEGLQDALDWKV